MQAMTHRVFNFNPGPSTLPLDVLKIVREELLNYRGTGMSVMELSHRSPEYDAINAEAMALLKELMGLGDDFKILFLGGGASTQFALVPMNFLRGGQVGAYVDTGTWATKAMQQAQIQGNTLLAASSQEAGYTYVPTQEELGIPDNAAYLHITTNNTIKGTQYHYIPETGGVPLIADMSSDICSRKMDFSRFSMIYAGAQKNLGPSGVTVVAIRDDLLEECLDVLPTMFNYQTHAAKKSLYNTPPCFAVYIVKLVLERIKNGGGLENVAEVNEKKKDTVYALIDEDPDYFRGTAREDSRSWMNVTLRLPSEDLEQKFIAAAKEKGLVGLKGHRSVGGIRISLYNAMTLEGAEKVAAFMQTFRKTN
jgi:phosphoserine aminotransferase